MNTTMTPQQREQRDADIAAARAEGIGVVAVGEMFGVSQGTVSKAVARYKAKATARAATVEDQDDMQWAAPCDYAPQTPVEAPEPSPSATMPSATYSPAQAPADDENRPSVTPVEASNSHGTHTDTPEPLTALHTTAVSEARRATAPDELPEGPERVVFCHSPVTRAVWHAARSRMASPWGVLGYVMSLTVATTGPHVRTPATVGGAASLNMLVGLVGAPGAGKGAARRTALDLFEYTDSNGTPVHTPMLGVGSGEGIAQTFALVTRTDDNGQEVTTQPVTRAVFDDTEVSTLAKKSDRRGSTLLPMLCKAYMGEDLGNQNGSAESSRLVPDHSYRMCLTVGIQPDRAGVLLDDVGGGTPQRFTWMPVAYPGMPDVTPHVPDVFKIRLPFGTMETVQTGVEPVTVTIPTVAENAIRRARLSSGRGESQGLDGHTLLTREKVAIALALMSGSLAVTDADWHAAGAVIALSTATREACREACKGAAVEASAARRIEDAEGKDQAAEHLAARYAATVREKVLGVLEMSSGAVPFRDLNNRVSGSKVSDGLSQRDRLPGVLHALIEDGLVLSSETVNGRGEPTTEYALPRV
ncbi:MAG: hypothetical protein ACTIIQ_08755 [Corynebacterium variabile]|uniref:hypothetical protein n=1 Tax=Corynebacterium variabile TaxID=1727 RepID=UPI003F9DE34F